MPSMVFFGLGTNLGDRPANLRSALAALAGFAPVTALSGVWETAPLYVTDQPAFLNMAAAAETDLAPADLLGRIKALEDELGRVASVRYGPRLIDIDILLYDDLILATPDLIIPHPRLPERHFALAPLAEIAGDRRHPQSGLAIAAMLAALPAADDVHRLGLLEI